MSRSDADARTTRGIAGEYVLPIAPPLPTPGNNGLTIAQLNDIFQRLTMSMLGYDATLWNLYQADKANWSNPIPVNPFYHVRLAWPTDGAPAWKITEDVVILRVVESDDRINRQRDVRYSSVDDLTVTQESSMLQVDSVFWVFYGPNAYDHARIVRNKMFYTQYQNELTRNNLAIIPDISAPRRIPESFPGGQWWERADLNINFNERVAVNETVSTAAGVDVIVKNNEGVTTTISQGGI